MGFVGSYLTEMQVGDADDQHHMIVSLLVVSRRCQWWNSVRAGDYRTGLLEIYSRSDTTTSHGFALACTYIHGETVV